MTGRLNGQVALVIGAARGIGEGIAQRFVEEGARVVIADTEVEAGKETATRLKGLFVETDISRMDHAQRAVQTALDGFGGLDIIVQNAGIYPWTLIENTSPEEWDKVLAVNLKGTFLAARAALPHMKQNKSGRMIFTSSITGPRVTSPGHGHYSASKAGINGFIKSAALEFSGYGITVNGIEPGNILTSGMQMHRSEAFIKSPYSSPPTRPPTSPARRSSSTAARRCPRGRISGSTRSNASSPALAGEDDRPSPPGFDLGPELAKYAPKSIFSEGMNPWPSRARSMTRSGTTIWPTKPRTAPACSISTATSSTK